ncbi:family 16 glycoside hydrolase [Edaphobacter modestus]|nr:family 16 glycoside hydrolase [Edaphobacter modestus]
MPRPRHNGRALAAAALSLLFLAPWMGASEPAGPLPTDEASQGWIRLFDGTSRSGWSSNGDWQIAGNALVSDSAEQSRLRMTASFSDFDLKFEARMTGGPATLLLRADPQSKPAQPGYTMSLSDGTMEGISGAEPASTPATRAWNTYEVKAEGTHLLATLNGKMTADGKNTKNRVGYFEFAAPRGTKLEVRSIQLKPLGLDRLYNGSNLDGWRAVAAPAPEKKSKLKLPIPGLSGKPKPSRNVRWSGSGGIHGEGGEGLLESTTAYDDFVLQFTAKTSAIDGDGHTATEIFFRGTPGQFDSGYAISTDTATARQLEDGKSFGVGGLVRLEKARASSIAAGQPFTGTVIARAHRITVWINGTLVTDYYDSRPEGAYHSAAGPLGFRIQSDKAKLDLLDVQIAALPKGPAPPPPPAPVLEIPGTTPITPAAAPPAAIPVPTVLGPSPEDKANQEQIRRLTMDALSASTPEEAVRINKQILFLDPGDMPAQQRLDKAQGQIDAANAQREHGMAEQQASTTRLQENIARRDALVRQTQDALLQGSLNQARDRLNDAQRLGASGPAVDRLQALIRSRLRDRLLLRAGLGGGGLLVLVGLPVFFWRRRGRTVIAYLIALDGVDKGKRYLLNQEVTHIGGVAMDGGRKNEVLVRDPDRQVSRFHCEVHKRDRNCYLIDLDSSNGTSLRNHPLQPGVAARLRDGDRFTLARAAAFELHLERQ